MFHAEKSLKTDPKTSRRLLSASDINGKIDFPFSGVEAIGHGRGFGQAKCVDSTVLAFGIEYLGFVCGRDGQEV